MCVVTTLIITAFQVTTCASQGLANGLETQFSAVMNFISETMNVLFQEVDQVLLSQVPFPTVAVKVINPTKPKAKLFIYIDIRFLCPESMGEVIACW